MESNVEAGSGATSATTIKPPAMWPPSERSHAQFVLTHNLLTRCIPATMMSAILFIATACRVCALLLACAHECGGYRRVTGHMRWVRGQRGAAINGIQGLQCTEQGGRE